MTYVTCRLTAKNRDQLRNPTPLKLRPYGAIQICLFIIIEYGLPLPFTMIINDILIQVWQSTVVKQLPNWNHKTAIVRLSIDKVPKEQN